MISELIGIPASESAVPPPRLPRLEGERIELEGRRVDVAIIERCPVVDIVFSGEVPVLVKPDSIIPGRVCLLIHNALSRATSVIAKNLFRTTPLGPGVIVMPKISDTEQGGC